MAPAVTSEAQSLENLQLKAHGLPHLPQSQRSKLADEISNSNGDGGNRVDALDEKAIESHLDSVLDETGRVDISFNAVGVPANIVADKGMQGIPLTDIPVESFTKPIATYTRTHFLTGRAAVRRMIEKGTQGVILMHTPEPARMGLPLLGGMAPAWGR
jgi:NAD(P)-dependent dehydrogenase (short-subunit alcohol dehydrogenase family)